jgi:type II secretory pathway pseudopilin PulG
MEDINSLAPLSGLCSMKSSALGWNVRIGIATSSASCLKLRRSQQHGGMPQHHRQSSGFTIIEIVVASVVVLIALAGVANSLISSLSVANKASVNDALEAAIAEDSSWLKAYAKSWNCQTGPYSGCVSKTAGLASAVNYLPVYSDTAGSSYVKFKTWCSNRPGSSSSPSPAHQLVTDAATASPAPPNTVQLPETLISMSTAPAVAQSYKLYRTISVDPSNGGNAINVTYATKSTDTPTRPFQRSMTLFVEASAWCP